MKNFLKLSMLAATLSLNLNAFAGEIDTINLVLKKIESKYPLKDLKSINKVKEGVYPLGFIKQKKHPFGGYTMIPYGERRIRTYSIVDGNSCNHLIEVTRLCEDNNKCSEQITDGQSRCSSK